MIQSINVNYNEKILISKNCHPCSRIIKNNINNKNS